MSARQVPLVEMRKIEKFYGRIHALRGVNLSISKGEIVGLLGDNGSGKSTLIKVLSGAVPYTSGEIFIKAFFSSVPIILHAYRLELNLRRFF